jgi:hypothetical protein
MENERVDIAPAFSFKPVDDDGNSSVLSASSSSSDFMMEGCLPTDNCRLGRDGTYPNLVKQRSTREDYYVTTDDAASAFRVISPYPFSHTSREEISERELLSDALLTLGSPKKKDDHRIMTGNKINAAIEVDYSSFFGRTSDENDVAMEECDDFSVSIQDADTISKDLGLGDPASFWEDGACSIPSSIFIVRSKSPTEISLGSDDEVSLRPDSSLLA